MQKKKNPSKLPKGWTYFEYKNFEFNSALSVLKMVLSKTTRLNQPDFYSAEAYFIFFPDECDAKTPFNLTITKVLSDWMAVEFPAISPRDEQLLGKKTIIEAALFGDPKPYFVSTFSSPLHTLPKNVSIELFRYFMAHTSDTNQNSFDAFMRRLAQNSVLMIRISIGDNCEKAGFSEHAVNKALSQLNIIRN